MKQNPNAAPKLNEFLDSHPDMLGSKILKLLINESGKAIDVIDLTLRLEFAVPDETALLALLQTAHGEIPMVDSTAIRQYKARLKKLIQMKADRLAFEAANDESALDPIPPMHDLDWEIDFLTRELRRVAKPSGYPKNFPADKEKAYHRYFIAISRLLEKAKAENPPVYDLVKRALHMGKAFQWDLNR
ncbi:MAG: hypothetical protein U1B83_03835 [Candidatus Cloacimonadaceae bacterium]|nr:hypothetical protein [Candidatus Cloacimonadaceae bacterium]